LAPENDTKQSKRNQLGEPTNFHSSFSHFPPLSRPFQATTIPPVNGAEPPGWTHQTDSQKEQPAANGHKMNVYTAVVKIMALKVPLTNLWYLESNAI